MILDLGSLFNYSNTTNLHVIFIILWVDWIFCPSDPAKSLIPWRCPLQQRCVYTSYGSGIVSLVAVANRWKGKGKRESNLLDFFKPTTNFFFSFVCEYLSCHELRRTSVWYFSFCSLSTLVRYFLLIHHMQVSSRGLIKRTHVSNFQRPTTEKRAWCVCIPEVKLKSCLMPLRINKNPAL